MTVTVTATPTPRTLSSAEARVLVAHDTPQGPGSVGFAVWGHGANGNRGSNCSAPYARIAGEVLRRLLALGLVVRVGPMLHWRRTRIGDVAAATNTADERARTS